MPIQPQGVPVRTKSVRPRAMFKLSTTWGTNHQDSTWWEPGVPSLSVEIPPSISEQATRLTMQMSTAKQLFRKRVCSAFTAERQSAISKNTQLHQFAWCSSPSCTVSKIALAEIFSLQLHNLKSAMPFVWVRYILQCKIYPSCRGTNRQLGRRGPLFPWLNR